METFELRCINCGKFHEYSLWQCYNQPYEQELPKKKSLEDLLEDFMIVSEKNCRRQEELPHQNGKMNLEEIVGRFVQVQESFKTETRNSIKNIEISLQIISKHLSEKSQSSFPSDTLISSAERCEVLQIEEDEECEIIEENVFPQILEVEEEESPREVSTDEHELESYNTLDDQEETMVKCEEVEEGSIVDFIFGDKLHRNNEKSLSLSIYLRNLWSKGAHGKEQTRGGAIVSTSWKQISEIFLNSLTLNLLFAAMISEYACNVMMLLCKNLHDLSGLSQFAIDPG